MSEIKSYRDLEKFARTAETIEIRAENYGAKQYLVGPKCDAGRVYWPDAILMSKALAKQREKLSDKDKNMVKVNGNHVRITFENGHGSYHILGEYTDYLVLNKISSSIDHNINP